MHDLEDSFTKLLGRQPTDSERQRLYHVKDALGIKNNDAIWLILMALEHYHSLYAEFPKKIADAAHDSVSGIERTAEAVLKATSCATVDSITHEIANSAAKLASEMTTTQKLRWFFIGGLTMAALFTGAIAYFYEQGKQAGYAESTQQQVSR